MNDISDDETDEDILSPEIPDEALERMMPSPYGADTAGSTVMGTGVHCCCGKKPK